MFPFRLSVSGFYQFLAGSPFTRTVNAVSALGRNLNQGNVVIHAGRAQRRQLRRTCICGPALQLRPAGRRLNIIPRARHLQRDEREHGHARQFALRAPPSTASSEFVPPRVVRFGVKVRF